MSTSSKNAAFIFRLSSSDPFHCVLYTDGGAFYSISTASDEPESNLPSPSPTKALFGHLGAGRPVGEVITVRSARGGSEFIGSVRPGRSGWEIVMGLEEERGVSFKKFFSLGVLGEIMGQKPKIKTNDGQCWAWQGYRSNKDLYLLSPTGEVAAQFRKADAERIQDPNAALIVYKCAFDIKELVIVSWIALERYRLQKAEEKGPKKDARKSMEYRSMYQGIGDATKGK